MHVQETFPTQNLRLDLVGILQAAWNAHLDRNLGTGHQILQRCEPMLDHLAGLDGPPLTRALEINRRYRMANA
jgi:hypothetical protein